MIEMPLPLQFVDSEDKGGSHCASNADTRVLLLVTSVFSGPQRLPTPTARFRALTPASITSRWSSCDWILVCAAVLAGAVALPLSKCVRL
jgi:hypothetical protein